MNRKLHLPIARTCLLLRFYFAFVSGDVRHCLFDQ
eukprot:IDg11464t1